MSNNDLTASAERVGRYEAMLNEAARAVSDFEAALERFAAAQERIRALNDYLGSPAWWADLHAAEAGLLPEGLACGVLSEDGVWNLLERNRELLAELPPEFCERPEA